MASTKSISKKARVPKIHQHYRGALFSFVSKPQLKGKEVTLPNGSRTELAMVRHSGQSPSCRCWMTAIHGFLAYAAAQLNT